MQLKTILNRVLKFKSFVYKFFFRNKIGRSLEALKLYKTRK